MPKIISQECKDEIILEYINGLSCNKSAQKFGYNRSVCYDELKRRGIEIRSRSERHRKYSLNQSFFNNIDNELKAYWLGFLSADGNVCGRSVGLELNIKDIDHLYKFTQSLNSDTPVRVSKKGKACVVQISSEILSNSLNYLGVVPCKSLILKPCTQLPLDLIRHYWRGLIDGDGSIVKRVRRGYKNLQWSIDLCGSYSIVVGFRDWVNGYVNSKSNFFSVGNIYRIYYGGNNIVRKIIEKLYKDSNIFLARKMELASQIIKES